MGGSRAKLYMAAVPEASCLLGPELQSESRADVSQPAVEAQQLRGSAGTNQLGDGSKKAMTKK